MRAQLVFVYVQKSWAIGKALNEKEHLYACLYSKFYQELTRSVTK
jgi:hypothetical protein